MVAPLTRVLGGGVVKPSLTAAPIPRLIALLVAAVKDPDEKPRK